MKNKFVDFPGWGPYQYTGEVNTRDQPHGLGTAVRGDGWRYEGTFPCYGGAVLAGRSVPDEPRPLSRATGLPCIHPRTRVNTRKAGGTGWGRGLSGTGRWKQAGGRGST